MTKDLNKKEIIAENLEKVAGGIGTASLPSIFFPPKRKFVPLTDYIQHKCQK